MKAKQNEMITKDTEKVQDLGVKTQISVKSIIQGSYKFVSARIKVLDFVVLKIKMTTNLLKAIMEKEEEKKNVKAPNQFSTENCWSYDSIVESSAQWFYKSVIGFISNIFKDDAYIYDINLSQFKPWIDLNSQ